MMGDVILVLQLPNQITRETTAATPNLQRFAATCPPLDARTAFDKSTGLNISLGAWSGPWWCKEDSTCSMRLTKRPGRIERPGTGLRTTPGCLDCQGREQLILVPWRFHLRRRLDAVISCSRLARIINCCRADYPSTRTPLSWNL